MRASRPPSPDTNPTIPPARHLPAPELSLVVANWQGADWLSRCLSSLMASARESGRPFELIVVDDASTDGSQDVVRSRFPRARLLQNPRNAGFRRTVNRGVRAARGRIVILCNNDLTAQAGFVGSLARWFDPAARPAGALAAGETLFAVSARTLAWYDGTPNQVCMGAVWRGGRLTPAWSAPSEPARCLFVQAGAAAYDRDAFLRLGGLSGLYEPGYWEDYDLSMRAARRGWAQVYDPGAVALHLGGGSMTRRYGRAAVDMMKARNHLLFEWRHLRSPVLLAAHAARLPLALARSYLAGGPTLFPGAFAGALARLPQVVRARLGDPGGPTPSDTELLAPWREFTPSY